MSNLLGDMKNHNNELCKEKECGKGSLYSISKNFFFNDNSWKTVTNVAWP